MTTFFINLFYVIIGSTGLGIVIGKFLAWLNKGDQDLFIILEQENLYVLSDEELAKVWSGSEGALEQACEYEASRRMDRKNTVF